MRWSILFVCLLIGSAAYGEPDKAQYELQERCGKQAALKFEKDYGNGYSNVSGTQLIYSYRNHYSPSLNKCFYLVVTRILATSQGKKSEVRTLELFDWPAPGSEDTELGVLMEPEVDHGEAEVYTRVQA
jgi:hypothetical protein